MWTLPPNRLAGSLAIAGSMFIHGMQFLGAAHKKMDEGSESSQGG